MNFFKLDPCHFVSLPSLSWNGKLKKSNIRLEQLTDIDMYLFFEQGIRGGKSFIKKRYAKANNKYMKGYDPEIESSYIMYLDANSLYSTSMIQKLPVNGFRWVSESQVDLKKYGKDNLGRI